MKRATVIVVALGFGSWLCIQFLGIAWFSHTTLEFYHQAFPFFVGLFVASAVLAFVQPPAARGIVMGLSLPTVLWCVFIFSQLQLEIRMYPAKARSSGWGWIGLAVVVISVAAAGVLIGYLVERRRRIRSPHAEMQPPGYS